MKILIIALPLQEDISALPQRYGGVGRTFYLLAKHNPNITILGNFDSLRNYELYSQKITASEEEEQRIIETGYLEGWDNNFDLIFHAQPSRYYKTKKPTLVWCPGYGETVHPQNINVLLHNAKNQHPQISNYNSKIHEFILGIDIPKYQEYKKENFIFQCSNHYPQINSIALAQLCLKYKVKCIFAGPIAEDYGLLHYIDNKTTFYEGIISEERKIELMKSARFFASLFSHPINEPTLSIKQAASYGCFILTSQMGAMNELINTKYNNGYFIRHEHDFSEIVHATINKNLYETNQKECYDSVSHYSVENMNITFQKAVNSIFKNNENFYPI